MKKILPLILALLFLKLYSLSQEVQFPPAVIPSGGGSSSSHAVNLSRWRIGEVHVFTLPSDKVSLKSPEMFQENLSGEWSVAIYPNPVYKKVNIRFDTRDSRVFAFEINDITGRKLKTESERLILPGEVVELDMTGFPRAIYLLTIIALAEESHKLFKIIKE